MSIRDDMIELYQVLYLDKCRQVSELRLQVRRWKRNAWILGIIAGILLGMRIWA